MAVARCTVHCVSTIAVDGIGFACVLCDVKFNTERGGPAWGSDFERFDIATA